MNRKALYQESKSKSQ